MRRIVIRSAILFVTVISFSACLTMGVEAWKRGILTKDEMQLVSIRWKRPSTITFTSARKPAVADAALAMLQGKEAETFLREQDIQFWCQR
jgi:hypothetical protein